MNENRDPRKVQQNIEIHQVLYFAPSVLIITEKIDQFVSNLQFGGDQYF